MNPDGPELSGCQLHLRAAMNLGFSERQAKYLAFWHWLARQRGETKQRGVLDPAAASGWRFGRRTN